MKGSRPGGGAWADPAVAYDAIAPEYADRFDGELAAKPFDRAILERFGAEIGPQATLFDLGCGPGHVGASLSPQIGAVVGIDRSAAMLLEARRHHPEVRCVQGDLRALPLDDAAVDAAVCFYSLIHLRRPEVPGALAEIHRVLRPGSSALLAVHGGEGVLHVDRWFDKPVRVDATLFGASELSRLVEGAGLRIRDHARRDPYDGEAQTERLYLWATRPSVRHPEGTGR